LSWNLTSTCWLALACSLTRAASGAETEGFSLESAGGRFGLPARHGSEGFYFAEAFLNCNLPVCWELGKDFNLRTRIDFTAGWLGRNADDAATSSVGPTFVLSCRGMPVSLEAGSSSTLISRHEFGDKDLGALHQFTTHIGLDWDFAPRWRLGYRFQHLSNAGVAKPNPGLSFHAFAFSYVF
jgi:hypothetical protein